MRDHLPDLERALNAAGLRPAELIAGSLQRCSVDGESRGKTSGAYRWFDDERPTCVWWNWKTGDSGVWTAEPEQHQTPAQRQHQQQRMAQAQQERQEAQARQWQHNHDHLLALWAQARPLAEHDPAGRYLRRRGLLLAGAEVLRYHPSLSYWDGEAMTHHPALLATVTTPQGELVALHRTYLTPEGTKADVPQVKKLTRTCGPMAGSSIKLCAPGLHGGRVALGVAEGIETALAASLLTGIPTWSCTSAPLLARFDPPPDVGALYIFADHDESGTGQTAAAHLAQRTARAGLATRTLTPTQPGTDWADELISRRAQP